MSKRKRYSYHVPPNLPLSPVTVYPSQSAGHPIRKSSSSSSPASSQLGFSTPTLFTPDGMYWGSSRSSSHSPYFRVNSEVGHVSFDSLHEDMSNIKILLIGDAGVGKTAMILCYYNELPTRRQWELMNKSPHLPDGYAESSPKKLSKQKRIAMDRKRYSLNDYEELFSLQTGSSPLGELDQRHGLVDDEYVINTHSTIGVDIKSTVMNIDNRYFKCVMWDTAGQERYKNAVIPSLYKGSHAVFLSYDICDMNSFQNCCTSWLEESLDNINYGTLTKTRFYLIGNKIDQYKERQVGHEHVSRAIRDIKEKYDVAIAGNFEVTCKWPNVVERAFNSIIKDLVENGCYESSYDSDSQTIPVEETLDAISNSEIEPVTSLRLRKPHNVEGRKKDTKIDLTRPLDSNGDDGYTTFSCCV